jgi:hypothetical protein
MVNRRGHTRRSRPYGTRDLYGRDGAVLPCLKRTALSPRRLAPDRRNGARAAGEKIMVNRRGHARRSRPYGTLAFCTGATARYYLA